MKTLIITVLFVLLSACSTTRKFNRSFEQQTEQTTQTDLRTDQKNRVASVDSSRVVSSAVVKVDERIVRLLFDTSKPVDPTTGLPPLQEAQLIDRKASERSATQSDRTQHVDSTGTTQTVDRSRSQTATNTAEEVDTKTTARISGWWWLLGAVAVVAGLLWLLRKTKLFR